MNDHVDPVIKKVLDEFLFVSHVAQRECDQCHKEARCIQFRLLGWLCDECEDFITDKIGKEKK